MNVDCNKQSQTTVAYLRLEPELFSKNADCMDCMGGKSACAETCAVLCRLYG